MKSTSEHVGVLGQRITFGAKIEAATFVRMDTYNTPPKPVFVITLRDFRDNALVYFGSPAWLGHTPSLTPENALASQFVITNLDEIVWLTATVKAHKVYREEKQTLINRPFIARRQNAPYNGMSDAGNG